MKELLEEIIVGIIVLLGAALVLSIFSVVILLYLPIKLLESTIKWISKNTTN
jgi:hypothetical protein|tara:strand:- start:282 stop:437 length:156 start_codon:yes stop_codon:yes gene_type:complete